MAKRILPAQYLFVKNEKITQNHKLERGSRTHLGHHMIEYFFHENNLPKQQKVYFVAKIGTDRYKIRHIQTELYVKKKPQSFRCILHIKLCT